MICLSCKRELPEEQFVDTTDGRYICHDCLDPVFDPAKAKEQRAADREAKREQNRIKAFLGMPTEKRVLAGLDEMHYMTGAHLFKVPTPAHHQHRSTVDFVGYTCRQEAIGVEAKATKDASLPMSRIKEHQAHYLDGLSDGHGYVLADFTAVGRWFLLPWSAVKLMRGVRLSNLAIDYYEVHPMRFWEYLRDGGIAAW